MKVKSRQVKKCDTSRTKRKLRASFGVPGLRTSFFLHGKKLFAYCPGSLILRFSKQEVSLLMDFFTTERRTFRKMLP
jgi:hypothetical protein